VEVEPTLWDLVNSIYNGSYQTNIKNYDSFVVNKALSQQVDCVLFANEININDRYLTNRQKYDFYYYGINKKKRPYVKWAKQNITNDLKVIMEYYNCSFKRAQQYERLLDDDQIKKIKTMLESKKGK